MTDYSLNNFRAYVRKGLRVMHVNSFCSFLIPQRFDVDKYLTGGWLREKKIANVLAKLKLAS